MLTHPCGEFSCVVKRTQGDILCPKAYLSEAFLMKEATPQPFAAMENSRSVVVMRTAINIEFGPLKCLVGVTIRDCRCANVAVNSSLSENKSLKLTNVFIVERL